MTADEETKTLQVDGRTITWEVRDEWALKQALASPSRYYGDGGTIHSTEELDVEVRDGLVVAVWFRCQMLPFEQVDVDAERAAEVKGGQLPHLTGVEVRQ